MGNPTLTSKQVEAQLAIANLISRLQEELSSVYKLNDFVCDELMQVDSQINDLFNICV